MKKYIIQILRVATCVLTLVLVQNELSLWWVAAIPWAVLNIVGILLSIPILLIIGAGAGAAQADWMSDEFIFTVLFIIPTVLAISASSLFMWLKTKRKLKQPNQNMEPMLETPAE